MPGLKEIRRRIQSVANTKQITRAMKLVSAAKLRRAQDAVLAGRCFFERHETLLKQLVADLPPGFEHPLLRERGDVRSRRIVLISGERGLCGAYNANLLKAVEAELRENAVETDFILFGRRGIGAAKRLGWRVAAQFEGLSEDASQWPLDEACGLIVEDFAAEKIDEVMLVFTAFVSAMRQEVTKRLLLPLSSGPSARRRGPQAVASGEGGAEVSSILAPGSVKYDPRPEVTAGKLMPLAVKLSVLQAGLEARAGEHAARMTAMDAATNNADQLSEKLRLFYNRARQNAITRELIDIVGGAEALK